MNEISLKPNPLKLRVGHVIKVGVCINDWNLLRHFNYLSKSLMEIPGGMSINYWQREPLRRALETIF
jgi:hypothetical protein